jgi:hypothetical protein
VYNVNNRIKHEQTDTKIGKSIRRFETIHLAMSRSLVSGLVGCHMVEMAHKVADYLRNVLLEDHTKSIQTARRRATLEHFCRDHVCPYLAGLRTADFRAADFRIADFHTAGFRTVDCCIPVGMDSVMLHDIPSGCPHAEHHVRVGCTRYH